MQHKYSHYVAWNGDIYSSESAYILNLPPLFKQKENTTMSTTLHRRNSVLAALKAVRTSDNSDALVNAIKAFDSYRPTLVDGQVLVWKHRYGRDNGQLYTFAAVYAAGQFYVTSQAGARTWDEQVVDWVTYNVRPDEVMIVSNSYPLEAF